MDNQLKSKLIILYSAMAVNIILALYNMYFVIRYSSFQHLAVGLTTLCLAWGCLFAANYIYQRSINPDR